MIKNADRIFHGGDYNPDQWDEATIDEDMRLFHKAGINLVTLPVFSWAKLEPQEGVYDFEWLDKLMDKFQKNDLKVCLATPTTAQPAWLSKKYPEVLPVEKSGMKRTHGMRVFFCVNSPKYRERAAAITEEMAKRYSHHPALALWHVANEYGTHCYCPTCEAKFRLWLKNKYKTIENLNEKWLTSFWGRTVYDFDEIMLPSERNDDHRFNPTVNLEYMRFMTDSTIECFENEASILKKYNPDITVQTNISGHLEKLDQFKMVKHMDVVAWDNYPAPTQDKSFVAMKHDLMRSLRGGESYMMQEQSPNQQNWQPYSKLKRPGELRMLSYQAMAHGSDTCLYFQLRQSVAGEEMYHGAVISHAGTDDTRTFRECTQIGQELERFGDTFLGARTKAEVGIIFDWDNWWSLEFVSKRCLSVDNFNYLKKMSAYYKVIFDKNVPVDFVALDMDFSKYKILYAPYLYMMKEGVAAKLEEFVQKGGTLVTTFFTGLVDEYHRSVFGAYPGLLRKLLGIRVEETDALFKGEKNRMNMTTKKFGEEVSFECETACDIIHSEGAKVLAEFASDFYAGSPCFTCNEFGEGKAYYIGTEPEEAFLQELFSKICKEKQISAPFGTHGDVELTVRENDKAVTVFALNHSRKQPGAVNLKDEEFRELISGHRVSGMTQIPPYDVLILRKRKQQ